MTLYIAINTRKYLTMRITRFLFIAFLLISTGAIAKKNTIDIGLLLGPTNAIISKTAAAATTLETRVPAVSFTADVNFKSNRRWYFSVPVRLHTTYLIVDEFYSQPTSVYTPTYNISITAASLGAGAGINYQPLMRKKLAIAVGAGLVPCFEAGNFRGVARANASTELHAGLRMMNRVFIGLRYTYFIMPYRADNFVISNTNHYNISNIQFDLRFRLRK